jgi:hypothetical protein
MPAIIGIEQAIVADDRVLGDAPVMEPDLVGPDEAAAERGHAAGEKSAFTLRVR